MITSENLKAYVKNCINEKKLGELSDRIDVSKTLLSLYANSKYERDPRTIEGKLRMFIASQSMSFRDERRLVQIYAILDEADNRENIIAAIAYKR